MKKFGQGFFSDFGQEQVAPVKEIKREPTSRSPEATIQKAPQVRATYLPFSPSVKKMQTKMLEFANELKKNNVFRALDPKSDIREHDKASADKIVNSVKKLNIDPNIVDKISAISSNINNPDGLWGPKTQDALNAIYSYVNALYNSMKEKNQELKDNLGQSYLESNSFNLLNDKFNTITDLYRKGAININDTADYINNNLNKIIDLTTEFSQHINALPDDPLAGTPTERHPTNILAPGAKVQFITSSKDAKWDNEEEAKKNFGANSKRLSFEPNTSVEVGVVQNDYFSTKADPSAYAPVSAVSIIEPPTQQAQQSSEFQQVSQTTQIVQEMKDALRESGSSSPVLPYDLNTDQFDFQRMRTFARQIDELLDKPAFRRRFEQENVNINAIRNYTDLILSTLDKVMVGAPPAYRYGGFAINVNTDLEAFSDVAGGYQKAFDFLSQLIPLCQYINAALQALYASQTLMTLNNGRSIFQAQFKKGSDYAHWLQNFAGRLRDRISRGIR